VTILSVVSNYDYPEMRRLAFTVTRDRAALFAKGAYELPEWVPGGFVTIEDPNDPLQVVAILAPFLGWLCPEVEWGIVYTRQAKPISYELFGDYSSFTATFVTWELSLSYEKIRVRRRAVRVEPFDLESLMGELYSIICRIKHKAEHIGLDKTFIDLDKARNEMSTEKRSVQIVRLEEK
jgi:hypothetical protein